MCLAPFLSIFLCMGIPLLVHEGLEEKAEHDVKHHKKPQMSSIAHTLSDAERRNEVIAGKRHEPIPTGNHGVDGSAYRDYRNDYGSTRSSHQSHHTKSSEKYAHHKLPSRVRPMGSANL